MCSITGSANKENVSSKGGEEKPPSPKLPAFVVKNIMQKRKDPQQRMEKYFPVVKKSKSDKNFQGFPMEHCVYEDDVGKFVYRPTCYGMENKKGEEESKFCRECLLRPCFVQSKWKDMRYQCDGAKVQAEDTEEKVTWIKEMMEQASFVLIGIFGRRYVEATPLPQCLFCWIDSCIPEEEESDLCERDDDLVHGAIDGKDYLTTVGDSDDS